MHDQNLRPIALGTIVVQAVMFVVGAYGSALAGGKGDPGVDIRSGRRL